MASKNRKSKKVISILLSIAMLLSCSTIMASAAEISTDTSDVSRPNTPGATFSWDNASVYFLLTDRFKNGDTSNDHSYNRGLDANGNAVTGIDTSATFHGGDFAGITQKIEDGYFTDLGVNAIWLSAPYEQIHGYVVGGDGSESFAHYAYHGYYAMDYTESDLNFGTKEEFQKLVDTAHENGIRIVMDVVLNHAGYNTLYDMDEYNYGTLKSGWQDYYFKHKSVNNATYHSYIDYEGSATDWGKWWGGNWIRAGLPGYSAGSGDVTGCLAGLPDFKTESSTAVDVPEFLKLKWTKEGTLNSKMAELNSYFSESGKSKTVTNYVSHWLAEWVRQYGVDGFRCDTAKHVEMASWVNLKKDCVQALREWKSNNPDKKLDDLDFWMTGECWDHGVSKDEYYTSGAFDSMINFNTQGGGLIAKGKVSGIYDYYASTLNTDPDFNVLSYVSSHDSVIATGDKIHLGSAFLLLPGGIQIFYGDESDRPVDSSAQTNGDHEVRADMNWDSMNEQTLAHWQTVGQFRNNHISVGAGANTALTATNGYAFARTYDKNGIKDKAAAVIDASANKDITIDVSAIWADGMEITNTYDGSQCEVKNGKVTFNSGANGTILMEEPNGMPTLSAKGETEFVGTQQVTINIKDANYAKCSVDGAKKFIVHNGDKVTIGETAYNGDTVKVALTAANDVGEVTRTSVFKKVEKLEEPTEPTEPTDPIDTTAKVHIKMADGSAPYLYAWQGASDALTSAWPGDKLTEKDADGWYTKTFDTDTEYNAVINNGGSGQTADITSLLGEVYIEVSSGYGTTVTGNNIKPDDPEDDNDKQDVVIHVKTGTDKAPNMYIWDNDGVTYNGGFPGATVSTKDEEGYYVFTVPKVNSCNLILSYGSNQNQSDNITGLMGDSYITATGDDFKNLDIKKGELTVKGYPLLKQKARAIKNMSPEDYTAVTWNSLYSLIPAADAIIAKGEGVATEEEINAMVAKINTAMGNLVLVSPRVTSMSALSTKISGVAACEAVVSVELNSKKYQAKADDITGIWSITVPTLANGAKANIVAVKNTVSSLSVSATAGSTIVVDKAELISTIAIAKSYLNGNYTEASIAALQSAITAAEATANSTVATQTQVDAQVTALNNAIKALVSSEPDDLLLGDVNGDNKVNMKDVATIQNHVAGNIELTGKYLTAGDVNKDGKVNMKDVATLQGQIAG